MSAPTPFVILHDLALPILAFVALLLAFIYVVFEVREGGASPPE